MNQLPLWGAQAPTGSAPTKPDPANPYGLRCYQRDAKAAIEAALQAHHSTLAVAATGTGKTRLLSALAGDWKGRVLVLAHRDELISQLVETLGAVTGERVGREQASERSMAERIIVGSVQTCYREHRLERLAKHGHFGLCIIDEAHHAPARSYRKVLDAFSGAKILGVTATPDRSDETALGKVFETVAFQYGIEDAIPDGWLVPIEGRRIHLDAVDVSQVKTTGGDLQVGQLDEVMLRAVEGIADSTLREFPDKRGVVFVPGKQSALYACERFNAIKPGCAVTVVEDTPKDKRRAIMAAIKRGDVQWFVNCLVATEGFDWPDAEVMVGARPTKSRALFTQMVGRVTRPAVPLPDGPENADKRRAIIAGSHKPRCIVVDLVGNSGRHSLMSVEDVLGGKYEEQEVAAAKAMAEQDAASNPEDNLKRARAELRRQQEQARLAFEAARVKSQVQYRVERYDPFEQVGLKGGLERDKFLTSRYGGQMATEGQRRFLEELGFDLSKMPPISMKGASQLIEAAKKQRAERKQDAAARQRAGLWTAAQEKVLKPYGIESATFEAARQALNYIASTGWGKRQPVNLARLRAIAAGGRAA